MKTLIFKSTDLIAALFVLLVMGLCRCWELLVGLCRKVDDRIDYLLSDKNLFIEKAVCWWFGCVPDYSKSDNNAISCKRCHIHECSYSDIVGDTRHKRFIEFLEAYFVRWWLPKKCTDCGKRYGKHEKCLPF